MKFIDLCAGIGGFSLGLEMAGMICAVQVEIDDYCTRILEKHWPNVPRWRDVKTIDPTELPAAQLICGGYPCQPFSASGKRRGQEDDRHLWPFIRTIVTAKRPDWCLFENVAGHVTLGLDCVLSDLEAIGYACQALIIPACAIGAPHRRDRIWIVANTPGVRQFRRDSKTQTRVNNQNTERWASEETNLFFSFKGGSHVQDNFDIREFYGFPRGVDRIKGLGNAVVPPLVCEIGRAILLTHGEG